MDVSFPKSDATDSGSGVADLGADFPSRGAGDDETFNQALEARVGVPTSGRAASGPPALPPKPPGMPAGDAGTGAWLPSAENNIPPPVSRRSTEEETSQVDAPQASVPPPVPLKPRELQQARAATEDMLSRRPPPPLPPKARSADAVGVVATPGSETSGPALLDRGMTGSPAPFVDRPSSGRQPPVRTSSGGSILASLPEGIAAQVRDTGPVSTRTLGSALLGRQRASREGPSISGRASVEEVLEVERSSRLPALPPYKAASTSSTSQQLRNIQGQAYPDDQLDPDEVAAIRAAVNNSLSGPPRGPANDGNPVALRTRSEPIPHGPTGDRPAASAPVPERAATTESLSGPAPVASAPPRALPVRPDERPPGAAPPRPPRSTTVFEST
jgi:hypothetical protein